MRTVKRWAKDGTIATKINIIQHNLTDLFNEKDSSYGRIMAKQLTPVQILGIGKRQKAVSVACFIVKTYLHLILTDIVNNGYVFGYFAGRWNIIKTRHKISSTCKKKCNNPVGITKVKMDSIKVFHFLPRPMTIKYLKGFYFYCILLGEYQKLFRQNKKNGNRY